jgi:hypothetical protein
MDEENFTYQDDICMMDHNIIDVFDDDDEAEDVDRPDEVERVDARYVRDLENKDKNNEDIELSEDECLHNGRHC